jgi:hypothetical protein
MKVNKQPFPETTVATVFESNITPQKPFYLQEWIYFLLLFFVVSIVWSQLSNYTWDDDALTRYMGVGNADKNPYVFLDSWNRPLFSVLFFLPIKFFGRMGVVVGMSLLTTLSGWFIYKAMQLKGYKSPSVVVVFLIFQTFLFGISRDAMTEPLASFVFSVGIYFYFKKNYNWFAIAGSLLPLARTETILLMPFWIIVLVQAKQYWKILLLGTGMVLWSLGLFIYSGNFFEIFKELLKSGDQKNKYTRMAVGHHFLKYVYVVGPIVFYFGVLGFFTSMKKLIKEHFIIAQFLVGFLLYVLFSSVMDLGQSGGALRNLITIAPLAAILAYYGYRFWVDTVTANSSTNVAPAAVTQNKKANQVKTVEEPKGDNLFIKKTLIVVYTLVFLLFAYQLFTNKLLLRQMYDEFEKDYTLFLFLLGAAFIVLLGMIGAFKKALPVLTLLLIGLQITFTLQFESPDSHENAERIVMNKMAQVIMNSTLKNEKVLTNHNWYHWVTGVNAFDTTKTGGLDSLAVTKAKPGNVIVWDAHYNNKNYSNLQVPFLLKDTTLLPIVDLMDSTNGFSSIVFLKAYKDTQKNESVFKDLMQKNTDNSKLNYYYANYLVVNKKDFTTGIVELNKALQLDPRLYYAYYLRGICYLNTNQLPLACKDLQIAANANNQEAKGLLAAYCK